MRTSWKMLAAVAASLVLAPQLAGADEVAEQLKLMQDRMAELEDRLCSLKSVSAIHRLHEMMQVDAAARTRPSHMWPAVGGGTRGETRHCLGRTARTARAAQLAPAR